MHRRLQCAVLAAVTAVSVAGCSGGRPMTSRSSTPTAAAVPTSAATTSRSPTPTAAAVPTSVPAAYHTLYEHLSRQLDDYSAAIQAMPAAAGAKPAVFATELLPANGNRLEQLLQPAAVTAVDVWLDRLHQLGFRGVTLGIKLPLLLSRFGPHAAAYTRFYTTVADHARARGMTVDVELGALFCGTAYAQCSYHWDSYAGFVSATVTQSKIILRDVRPDNLTILAEPTTEATLTHTPALATVAGAARYVHDVLALIGPRGHTHIGAGAATWQPSAYDKAILREPIDYLAVHIYPVSAQIAATLVRDTALARAAGKPIVADEVGLYKTDSAGSTAATADQVYRLDAFSFFQPLDVRFASITQGWARKAGASYLSPFWPTEFFAYLPWSPAVDALPFASLNARLKAAVTSAFMARRLTSLGRAWAPHGP